MKPTMPLRPRVLEHINGNTRPNVDNIGALEHWKKMQP